MSKLISSVREAIEKTGLKSGMTISFHHHMRNGDYVLNMVLEEAAMLFPVRIIPMPIIVEKV